MRLEEEERSKGPSAKAGSLIAKKYVGRKGKEGGFSHALFSDCPMKKKEDERRKSGDVDGKSWLTAIVWS